MPSVDEMVAAIKARDLGGAEKLLQQDMSLAHAKTIQGDSMLLLAAYHQAKPIIELLLTRGARPNLGAHGADPHATYLNGLTALHAAASAGDDASARLLLSHKARIDARTDDGKTPLDLAREKGHERLVRLLERAAETS